MGSVVAVHRSGTYTFSKETVGSIRLLAGLGVEGDAHAGARVRHRSRVRADPDQPNLRQVHLMPGEVLDEAVAAGFEVAPGQLGENVTTAGVDLLGLPQGTLLRLGGEALVAITGLRNPCGQIENFRTGLLDELREKQDGRIVRRAGVMAVVVAGGEVRSGDPIAVALPPEPHRPLEVV